MMTQRETSSPILFITGASGVGKTAVLKHLASEPELTPHCYFFDDIGVPSQKEMALQREAGFSWQNWASAQWVKKLSQSRAAISILEGQTTLKNIGLALEPYPDIKSKALLLDCTKEVRRHRLINLRHQPELATDDMENWSKFLRQEAKAMKVRVVDTSTMTIEVVANIVRNEADDLRARFS